MSPFLRAREEARQLRQLLVGDRADEPVKSTELLARVEDVLALGVQQVARTSGVLKGGKATLRRGDGFIYCRKDFEWRDKAYLIAHELGHFRLDPDTDEDTVHKSADEFAPASPASAHVAAYGARERDELQKNVFGRELLLPRHVARAMFHGGLGPRGIAKELEIPLEVARQQVLDGVLLPPYVPSPPAPLPDPSQDQLRAINAKEKHVHVVAGPGTGKTTTLIHRVKKLIEQDHVDPRKILVLTFTNKAALELVDRLQRAGVAGASEIWAGTFHAFGLEFLRKYYQHFDVSQDVAVADKLTQLHLTARALSQVTLERFRRTEDPYDWLPDVLEAILRVKEELIGVDDYLAMAVDSTDDEDRRATFRDVAAVARTYESALQQANMVDFVDLVSLPAQAIARDRASFTDVADRYQHILVDEFQDLTSAMLALTEELAKNASLWVVGDVRQAIYHWRGSSLDALLGFEDRFASARRCDLTVNRRSVSEVIALTKVVGEAHPLQDEFALTKTQGTRGRSGRKAALVQCDLRPSMWKALVDGVQSDLAKGIQLRDQTVIARKGAAVAAAARELKAAGVPVLYVGELMERPEIKDILAVVQLIVERSPRALLRVGSLATPKMKSADVKAVIASVVAQSGLQRINWLKSDSLPVSRNGEASRKDLARNLRGFSWSTNPWDFICELLLERRFLLVDLDDDTIDGHLRRLSQWQFAYMARVGDGDRKRLTLFRLLSRLRLRQQIREVYIDRELPPETNGLEGVRVMTVHGSKGLEFRSVHLVSVDGQHFRGAEPPNPLLPPEALGSTLERHKDESDVEKHNLLYVAVSRAKDALTVYQADQEFKFQAVVALGRAEEVGALEVLQGPSGVEPSTTAAPRPGAVDAVSSVTHDEFLTYARCPRQYLYRFGMEMGQEPSPNPSLQARALVGRTLKELARANRYGRLADAFEEGWATARLPDRSADPQLWDQAWAAAERGAEHLSGIRGKFLEATADIDGLAVGLPWGIATKDVGGVRLHCVGFYGRSEEAVERSDRILSQLMYLTLPPERVVQAELFDLVRPWKRGVRAKEVYRRSIVSTVTQRLLASDFAPVKDRYPCARCAYSYICPSLPAR